MAATEEERFEVFNVESYSDYPNAVPAGRYGRVLDAIKHAESVTYKMAIVDSKAESRGFIYCNWEARHGFKCFEANNTTRT
jgi:hypothetical protein